MENVKHGGEDWRKRLRRATFRGAFFWVESDQLAGGRRLVVHEFPMSELPYNEDMGQQARRFEVDAYVVGGQADKQAVALVQACTAPGFATLVLPLFGTVRARCLEVRTRREKDRQGWLAFRLRFVQDDLALSALAGSANLKNQINSQAIAIPPALLDSFQRDYLAIDVPDYVLRAAVGVTRDWLASFDVVVSGSELRGSGATAVQTAAQALYDNAYDLLAVGSVGDEFGQTSFVSAADNVSAKPLVDAVTGLLATYVQTAPPVAAIAGLTQLLGFGNTVPPVPTTTLNRAQQARNQDTLLELFNRSALVQLAVAVSSADYPARRDAIAARAAISELFSQALEDNNDPADWDVVQALLELQGKTVEFLSKLITDLRPVLTIEARMMMPSLYWSYRLYNDATRDEELWARNNIKHPAWMPVQFEALTR